MALGIVIWEKTRYQLENRQLFFDLFKYFITITQCTTKVTLKPRHQMDLGVQSVNEILYVNFNQDCSFVNLIQNLYLDVLQWVLDMGIGCTIVTRLESI